MKQPNAFQVVLTIVVGLVAISLFFSWPILTKVAVVLGLLSIFSSYFAEKLAFVWGKIGHALGLVNGSILLSIIFFIILTPIAFLMKILSKKDSLLLKKPTDTAFTTRNKWFQPKDLDNVW
jgi:hypothetical protein